MTADRSIRFAKSSDGTRIAWAERGSGPAVIYVPAWTDMIETGRGWALTRPYFDGRVIVYDRRGFGRSDWDVEHSLERYADDLESVAVAAGPEQIVLIGAAAGTFDSIAFAARSRRVQKILLIEPALRVEHDELPVQKALAGLIDRDFATFWRALLQFGFGWGKEADIESLVQYYVSATNPRDVRALMDLLYRQADLRPYAPEVDAECLLIHNADDSLMPPAGAASLARLLPHARLVLTHGDRFSRSDEALKEMRAFLGSDTHNERAGAAQLHSVDMSTWDRLTQREAEVLGYVATGASNKEIASALWLAPSTVARHLANAYTKLGVRNRAQATHLMDQRGDR